MLAKKEVEEGTLQHLAILIKKRVRVCETSCESLLWINFLLYEDKNFQTGDEKKREVLALARRQRKGHITFSSQMEAEQNINIREVLNYS